ncbi:MAG: carboxylating nicotinate-nucleotide diphosphorylase [Chloroflexi bacterium]|nr:carboxylating nicotinate-nucleotide diphosphorylase [Chloroflexota bacterium]
MGPQRVHSNRGDGRLSNPVPLPESEIERVVRRALREDLGSGDVTTNWIIPADQTSQAIIIAKAEGVIAGLEVARAVFRLVDPRITFEPVVGDGAAVKPRDLVARLAGPTRGLLSGERVALNFMQRLSGTASMARAYSQAIAGTRAVVLDTRKTTPGLRLLEKYAVRMGGGQNHRIGLYDMVLIKDNHIQAAGSITAAVQRVKAKNRKRLPIEVEVRTLPELEEALGLGVDRILLDNMDCAQMRQAVEVAAGRTPLEASGNVTLQNIRQVAETGVDYISSGALTHSVKALDLSLDFV